MARERRWRRGSWTASSRATCCEGAIAFAREIAEQEAPRTSQREAKLRDHDPAIFAAARAQAQKTKRGQTAPLAAIEAVENATRLAFEEGCEREAELFRECLYSTQCKALIHAFFAERAVSKIPGMAADTPVREIRRAAVVGAGTMGGGITMTYANAGIPVIVKETSQEALDRGMAIIRKNYAGSVKKGRLSQAAMDERLARITPQLTYAGFEDADIIVEAVFEGMALKKQVFAEIDAIAKPELYSGVEYVLPRYRRDCVGDRASGDGAGESFFQSGECDAAAGDCARQGNECGSDRHVHGAGQETEEGGRAGGKLPGLHRQPYAGAVPARSPVSGGRGGQRGGRQPGAVRFRHGDGSAGDERPGGTGRGLAHTQGVSPPGAAGCTPAAGGGPAM